MTEITPAPPFDRVMLASVVFAPLLAVLAAVAGMAAGLERGGMDEISGLAVAAFCFVLLGSMVLNGWLLLRHPQTLASGAATRPVSIALAVQEGLLVVWIALLAAGIIDGIAVGFCLALALASIVVFVFALGRYLRPGPSLRLDSIALPGWARAAGMLYLLVTVVALLWAILAPSTGFGAGDSAGLIGGPTTWVLVVLGLPWSHPLYIVALVVMFTLTIDQDVAFVPTVIAALGAIANVAIVGQLLVSPAQRVRIVNWFFRLGKQKAARVEPVPPIA